MISQINFDFLNKNITINYKVSYNQLINEIKFEQIRKVEDMVGTSDVFLSKFLDLRKISISTNNKQKFSFYFTYDTRTHIKLKIEIDYKELFNILSKIIENNKNS